MAYANSFDGNGLFESCGTNSSISNETGGGASGGGSINLFMKDTEFVDHFSYHVEGGKAASRKWTWWRWRKWNGNKKYNS